MTFPVPDRLKVLWFLPTHGDGRFLGSAEGGIEVAAQTIDRYLIWGEPPAAVAGKVAKVRARAFAAGREISFCIRLHVIVRDTAEEAWAAAGSLVSRLVGEAVANTSIPDARAASAS